MRAPREAPDMVFDVGPLGWLDVGVHFQDGPVTVAAFHRYAARQAESFPLTSTPADTHDLKRSSDVSDRLNAITHDPEMIEQLGKYIGKLDVQAGKVHDWPQWRDAAKWRYFIYCHAAALWQRPARR